VVPGSENRVGYGVLAEGSFDTAKVKEAIGAQDILTLVEAPGRWISASRSCRTEAGAGSRQVLE